MNNVSINKHLEPFLHVAFWAFMFLSPLSYMRGRDVSMLHYLMNCMAPLLLMVMFYANYLWLTPRLFVTGKHRYFLLINLLLVVLLGIGLHYWMDLSRDLFVQGRPRPHEPLAIDEVLFVLRDIINLAIFAAVGTALVLAQRWQHNEQARHDAEAARTEAELKTLRNQINPHFLLNTLNNIYALTAFDAPKAQEAIQELAKLLRHLLYDNDQPTVPIEEEIAFLQHYINLMKIRLPQSVKVETHFNIADPQQRIAPMIFISLIENAFKHGVSPTIPSFIDIHIEATKQHIICDISNSYHPKTASDHSGHGIGLQQVQQRLDLSYPGCYTWQHSVSEDGKTYSSRINIHQTK